MLLNKEITVYDNGSKQYIEGVRICDKTTLKTTEKGLFKSGSIVVRIFKNNVDIKEGARLVVGVCADDICPEGAYLITSVKKNKGVYKTHYKVVAER